MLGEEDIELPRLFVGKIKEREKRRRIGVGIGRDVE